MGILTQIQQKNAFSLANKYHQAAANHTLLEV